MSTNDVTVGGGNGVKFRNIPNRRPGFKHGSCQVSGFQKYLMQGLSTSQNAGRQTPSLSRSEPPPIVLYPEDMQYILHQTERQR